MHQNDEFGYKARPTMLAEKKETVNVWKQIGAQEPSRAAKQAMGQSDDFGYKARPTMLADANKAPVNVWQQIGAPQPSVNAQQVWADAGRRDERVSFPRDWSEDVCGGRIRVRGQAVALLLCTGWKCWFPFWKV